MKVLIENNKQNYKDVWCYNTYIDDSLDEGIRKSEGENFNMALKSIKSAINLL